MLAAYVRSIALWSNVGNDYDGSQFRKSQKGRGGSMSLKAMTRRSFVQLAAATGAALGLAAERAIAAS